jgi:hypothetical protein
MSRDINIYAPPLFWGPWSPIASPLGSGTFSIECNPIGSTQIFGRVRYYKGDNGGTQVDDTFIGSTIITTSNSVQTVELCLKGNPFGSQVRVTVDP